MWLVYDFKEHGVDLEVEGVRYYRDASQPDAYIMDPPPSRGGDLELEGGVSRSLHVIHRVTLKCSRNTVDEGS